MDNPAADEREFRDLINPNSLVSLQGYVEQSLAQVDTELPYQFEREGYFCLDNKDSKESLVFNRVVALKDSWAKKQ